MPSVEQPPLGKLRAEHRPVIPESLAHVQSIGEVQKPDYVPGDLGFLAGNASYAG